MNASAVNIPLVNSTQILTNTSAIPVVSQAPVASVVNPTPIVASTPIVSQVPVAASTPIVSQVPVAASTPIISQVPVAASTPIVSQVPVAATTPIVSQVQVAQAPLVAPANQHFTNQPLTGTLVDEDYRLGRGILDDFRPSAIQSQYGVSNVVNTSAYPVNVNTTAPVLSTSAVIPNTVNPTVIASTGGANTLKEFL